MNGWLEIAASNVVLATALTAAAAAVARFAQRPAWVHALCLLALLKLVTPPLFTLPVLPAEPAPAQTPAVPVEVLLAAAMSAPSATPPAHEPPVPLDLASLLLGAWALGSLVVLSVATVRTRRFSRVLAEGAPASAGLAAEVESMARRLGLMRPPTVTVVPGRVSPMLWPSRHGLRLVLPALLLRQLTPDQRSTLLLHELAHVRRRDHWVRHIEAAVSVLFWWLPTMWWLRKHLRNAEEQCCDAWVVWAMPEKERAYADALLSTVDFLSGPHVAMPPRASGAGHVHHLKQRLTMIMEATTPRKLGGLGRLAALTLAVLFLPALPTRAQEGEGRTDESMRRALTRIAELEAMVEKMMAERSNASDKAVDKAAETVRRAAARIEKDNENFRKRLEKNLAQTLKKVAKQLDDGELEDTMAQVRAALTEEYFSEESADQWREVTAKWKESLPKMRDALERIQVDVPSYAWRDSEEIVRRAMERYSEWGDAFDSAKLNQDIADEISENLTKAWKKTDNFDRAFDKWFTAMNEGEWTEGKKDSKRKKSKSKPLSRAARIQQIQDQLADLQNAADKLRDELRQLQKNEK